MSGRILVVDDIEANRRLLEAKLETQYFDVLEAPDGKTAIKIAKEEQPDIILLDVMMPGLSGFEVCEILKADAATAHIPVVMVTALNDMENRIRGLECGAEDFLTKPVDDFALMSRVTALLRYNSVATELRQRQAKGLRDGTVDALEQTDIDGPARIFIVDDNPRSSQRIARLLKNSDHHVMTLEEAQGLGDLSSRGVDILIISLDSSSYDALKLVAHFKMSEATRGISIIIVCDELDRKRASRGLELGASDIILKPVDSQELLARVRTQTRRQRYLELLRKRVDRGLELSVIDQLTGLYNRRYMAQQMHSLMKRAVTGGTPLSVMMADIDHFKHVNDTYGHEAGDDVLRELANRFNANVRPIDIICRPGGEEFLIIMPDTPGDLARAAAERIRLSVASEPFAINENSMTIPVTLSAGISTITGPEDTVSDILRRADTALYQAKQAGRNRVETLAA